MTFPEALANWIIAGAVAVNGLWSPFFMFLFFADPPFRVIVVEMACDVANTLFRCRDARNYNCTVWDVSIAFAITTAGDFSFDRFQSAITGVGG